MPASLLGRLWTGRMMTADWVNAARNLITKAGGHGGVSDTLFQLFSEVLEVDADEHNKVRELKRKLGMAVDETVRMATVSDVTHSDAPVIHLHGDIVVGTDTAYRQLYKHYNKFLNDHDQDGLGEEEFCHKMMEEGSVIADAVSAGGETIRKMLFSTLQVTSIGSDVEPFPPESPAKKPILKKKPTKKEIVEEEEEDDDWEDAEDDDDEEDDEADDAEEESDDEREFGINP